MKNAVDWIKGALAKKDLVQHFTHYRVEDGEIRAYDGRMLASHPFPYDGTFLAPGTEFEAILDRMTEANPDIKETETGIRISSGRFRGDVRTLPMTEFPELPIGDDWLPFPDDLLDVFADMTRFISDNATKVWAMGIAIVDGRLYATNNVSMAFADRPETAGMKAILPVWAVQFAIDRREGLKEWQVHEGYCAFRWDNGAWMRTQLMVGEIPDMMPKMAEEMEQATFEITPEWRHAYDLVTGVSKESIHLHADRIIGSTDHSDVEHEAESPLPESQDHSTWSVRYLNNVISVATHWQPDNWPKPATFHGERVRGLLVGRT